VASLAFQHIRTAMVERAAPGQALAYEFPMGRAAVEKVLRDRPAGWFHDYDEMLLRCLVDAVEEGKRIQGADIQRWQYGRWLRVRIDHPVIHQVPMIGTYFDIAPTPMSGSTTTPKQTTLRLAPSMRMNADLGDWSRSLLNITIGQSGQIFSSHYRDEWEHYYYAQSYPMQFTQVTAQTTLTFQP
jgi:penicillin amidase